MDAQLLQEDRRRFDGWRLLLAGIRRDDATEQFREQVLELLAQLQIGEVFTVEGEQLFDVHRRGAALEPLAHALGVFPDKTAVYQG